MKEILNKKKFKILGLDYIVKPFASNARDDGSMGRADTKLGLIHLCIDLPETIKEQTTLHEVLHVIDENLGTKLSEEQITALAAGLYSFFKDNK